MNMMETEVTLIDAEENKTYTVTISIEDAERAYNGKNFFSLITFLSIIIVCMQ